MIIVVLGFGDPNSFLEQGSGPGLESGPGHNVDNGGVAVKRERGGERVADGEIEEAVGEGRVVADLNVAENVGNLGRGETLREERE